MLKIQTIIDNKNGNNEVEMLLEITNTDANIPYTLRKIEVKSCNLKFESYKLEFISNDNFKSIIQPKSTIKHSITLSDFKEDFIYSIMLDELKEDFYHHNNPLLSLKRLISQI